MWFSASISLTSSSWVTRAKANPEADGALHLLVCNNSGCGQTISSQTSWSANTWYYVVGTYSAASGLQLYVNGNPAGSNSLQCQPEEPPTRRMRPSARWSLSSGDTDYFHGILDEVRISNIARSPGWVATEYNNQSSPRTFASVGTLQTQEAQVGVPSFQPDSGRIQCNGDGDHQSCHFGSIHPLHHRWQHTERDGGDFI